MPPELLFPTARPFGAVLIPRENLLESPVTIEAFPSVRGWFDISSCPHPFAKKGSPLHFCSYRLPLLPVVLHNHRTNLSYHFYICNVVRDRQNSNILQFSITDFQHVHEAGEFAAVHIPLQNIFDRAFQRAPQAHWAEDGVHPTLAGHQMITDAWIRAADNLF